jgi:hypothetical protein
MDRFLSQDDTHSRASSSEIIYGQTDQKTTTLGKQTAFSCVPYSSLFYTSKPLTAALSRRRTQGFFFVVGIYSLFVAYENKRDCFSVPNFKYVRFTALQSRRDYMNCKHSFSFLQSFSVHEILKGINGKGAQVSNESKISRFGLLLNGQDVLTSRQAHHQDGSITFQTKLYSGSMITLNGTVGISKLQFRTQTTIL